MSRLAAGADGSGGRYLDLGETVHDAASAPSRVPPPRLGPFERIVNIVHEHAPQARIAFKSAPADTAEAVRRRT